MYESFFRLKARPFSAAPVVQNYYPGEAIEQARQTCIRAIERAEGPVLVIGPSGVGKSSLCRLLAAYFESTYQVALLSNAQICTHKALLQSFLFELGLSYRDMDEGELRLHLLDHLQSSEQCPHGVLLIVDEAHTLPIRLLEEIRMLTNVVRREQPRLRLVLAGGPRLDERFASPKLESFNQRIAARCYLQAMSRMETDDYIRSQLSFAGGSADVIFSDEAFRAVFQATDGIPRLVNQVCNHALLLASQSGNRKIDAARVGEAWADLQQLPAPWQEKKVETDNNRAFIEFGSLEPDASDSPPVPLVAADTSALERCEKVLDFLSSNEAEVDPSITFGTLGPSLEASQGFDSPIYEETETEFPAEEAPEEPVPSVPAMAVDPFQTMFAEEEIVTDPFVPAASLPAQTASRDTVTAESPVATAAADQEEEEVLASVELPVESSAGPADDTQPEQPSARDEALASPPASNRDSSLDAWDELLTILPTADASLPDGSLSGMFEITIFETALGGGVVLDAVADHHPAAPATHDESPVSDDEGSEPCVVLPAVRPHQHDDRDLIQLADDEEPAGLAPSDTPASGDARRMEYRELFAQLRRPV
jgi:type II secretory pathway predicted ATPase ExeA